MPEMTIEEYMREHANAFEEFKTKHKRQIDDLEAMIKELRKEKARPGAGTADGGDPVSQHSKAYDRFLRKGITDDLADFQTKEMSVGSDPDGGFAVPQQLDNMIGRLERDATPMRQICTVLPVSSEAYEKLISLGGAAGGWVDEADARPATDTPTLASVKPYFGEVYANPAVTQKLLDDAMFNVADYLAEEVGLTFADYENTAFLTGNGVKKPRGLLQYTITANPTFGQLRQIRSGVAGATTADKLIEVSLAPKARYLQNATWMMSTSALLQVRQLKNSNNDYLFKESTQPGRAGTLLGYPIVLNEAMPVPAVDAHAIVFGDFKRGYKIADVRDTRILRDPYTVKGKVHFYTTKRLGGALEDSHALVVHTLSA